MTVNREKSVDARPLIDIIPLEKNCQCKGLSVFFQNRDRDDDDDEIQLVRTRRRQAI